MPDEAPWAPGCPEAGLYDLPMAELEKGGVEGQV